MVFIIAFQTLFFGKKTLVWVFPALVQWLLSLLDANWWRGLPLLIALLIVHTGLCVQYLFSAHRKDRLRALPTYGIHLLVCPRHSIAGKFSSSGYWANSVYQFRH